MSAAVRSTCKLGCFYAGQVPLLGAQDVAMLAASATSNKGAKANGVERSVELTADGLWSEVAGRLKEALNDTTYRTWFAAIEAVELSDGGLVVAAPNNFTREWIEGHFLDLVRAAVRGVAGDRCEIRIIVRPPAGGAGAPAAPQPVRRPAV